MSIENIFIPFSRDEWKMLRGNMPSHHLTQERLDKIATINEKIPLSEIDEIYLPLSRLLHLHYLAAQQLHQVTQRFIGKQPQATPYIIGIAGSVGVGKSTTARLLEALLKEWPEAPHVELVTTDGFLYPNAVLEKKQIMHRKGFPESYDMRKLIRFLRDLKAGVESLTIPSYSHYLYDVTEEPRMISKPQIVILEGINVLQIGPNQDKRKIFVSDFFDFSIYIDAEEALIKEWYIERFALLCEQAAHDENAYFHQFSLMPNSVALNLAKTVWNEINLINLKENILPFKHRAQLILNKHKDHLIQDIFLKKL